VDAEALSAINSIAFMMAETQVLFRVEEELLAALDRMLPSWGFGTRNEWFRAQIRRALDEEVDRRRLAQLLDRLTVEGVTEADVVKMVKAWRFRKSRP